MTKHPCSTCRYGITFYKLDGNEQQVCGRVPGEVYEVDEKRDCELWELDKEAEYDKAMALLEDSDIAGIAAPFSSLSDAVDQLLWFCKDEQRKLDRRCPECGERMRWLGAFQGGWAWKCPFCGAMDWDGDAEESDEEEEIRSCMNCAAGAYNKCGMWYCTQWDSWVEKGKEANQCPLWSPLSCREENDA